MAALTTQLIKNDGTVPTFSAAAATDTAEAPSRVGEIFVVYKNTNAAGRTVTVTVPGNETYGTAKPDPTFALAATTGERWIPLYPEMANSSARVDLAVDVTTNVTVAVVKFENRGA